MKRAIFLLAALFGVEAAAQAQATEPYHLIRPTPRPEYRQPDGNSIFLEAPDGLILIDTGRHIAHQQELLAYARERGRPIVAIVNTHWHLDHNGGNAEIREAFPEAEIHTSNAIEGALVGFFAPGRIQAEQYIASGQADEALIAEIRGDFAAMDDVAALRPTHPVTASQNLAIAGRPLRVNLANFAATEGDVWIYDPASRVAIVGDLVVAAVPYMDTACPEGWRRALDDIAATPFTTLIPGHGAAMDRPQFLAWRTAFNNLVDCGVSDRPRDQCIAGWQRDAAQFIPAGREEGVGQMVGNYLDARLRVAPEERQRFCRPLTAA